MKLKLVIAGLAVVGALTIGATVSLLNRFASAVPCTSDACVLAKLPPATNNGAQCETDMCRQNQGYRIEGDTKRALDDFATAVKDNATKEQ